MHHYKIYTTQHEEFLPGDTGWNMDISPNPFCTVYEYTTRSGFTVGSVLVFGVGKDNERAHVHFNPNGRATPIKVIHWDKDIPFEDFLGYAGETLLREWEQWLLQEING